jgi:hypothetical protein
VAVSGTEVTIDCADLPVAATADANGGWIFFKFAAPVTLLAATAYQLAAKTSTATQVSLFRDGTTDNLSRFLRTTTTGAPAAGDDVIVCGEYTGAGTSNSFTVTMDETATTNYGATSTSLVTPALAICSKGTLTFGTAASTNYYLKLSGNLIIYSGGTLNDGTVATPMPSTSTSVIEFNSATNVDFGLTVRNLGTFVAQGNAITTVKTLLNTDEAAAATVIGVVSTAGWVANDEIVIASTSRTGSETEKRTISTVDSATQVTITAGLTNAHSGTSPTQTEVGNITRNVKIRGISTTLQGYIDIKATSTIDWDYVEISNMGSATTNKRGIDVATTTGSFNMQGCAIHDFAVASSAGTVVTGSSTNNFTIDNCVYYLPNSISSGISVPITSGTAWTVTNSLVMGMTGGAPINILDVGGTFTDCTAAGNNSTNSGFGINMGETNAAIGTISGLISHSNGGGGITCAGGIGTMSSFTVWRNNTTGFSISSATDCLYDGVTAFGNLTRNLLVAAGKNVINNLVANGDTTFPTAAGIDFNGGVVRLDILNGDLSTVSGIKTAHTNDINLNVASHVLVTLHNTKLGASTEVDDQNFFVSVDSFIGSQKHDTTAGNHKTWKRYGTITIDTTISDVSPSVRMTPNNASNKLDIVIERAAVSSGGTATVSAKVRESVAEDGTDYNGNRIRLIVKRNIAAGITADTVLATATSASEGAFETISGTTAAVTDDAILEFCVDCDGTTGWINVDSVSVTAGSQATGDMKHWHDGLPYAFDEPAGGGSGGSSGARNLFIGGGIASAA